MEQWSMNRQVLVTMPWGVAYSGSSSSSVLGSLWVSYPSPLLCAGFPLKSYRWIQMTMSCSLLPLVSKVFYLLIWGLQPCRLFPCANLSVFYRALFTLCFLSQSLSITPPQPPCSMLSLWALISFNHLWFSFVKIEPFFLVPSTLDSSFRHCLLQSSPTGQTGSTLKLLCS